jgi:hypothetical protein
MTRALLAGLLALAGGVLVGLVIGVAAAGALRG